MDPYLQEIIEAEIDYHELDWANGPPLYTGVFVPCNSIQIYSF